MCGTSRFHQESKDNAVATDALPDLLGENAQLSKTQTEGFELLPDEMLQQVISFLPVCVVPLLQSVCQRWKTVVRFIHPQPLFSHQRNSPTSASLVSLPPALPSHHKHFLNPLTRYDITGRMFECRSCSWSRSYLCW